MLLCLQAKQMKPTHFYQFELVVFKVLNMDFKYIQTMINYVKSGLEKPQLIQ